MIGDAMGLVSGANGAGSLLDAQAGRLLSQAAAARGAGKSGPGGGSTEDAKIAKSSHDFESILLGSWLQGAEQSFATVPGGNGEGDDEDAGKDQFQGIAMQALAGSMTTSGGIGIAKMIATHLRHASEAQDARAGEAPAKTP